jgi:hypothetical protein
MSYWQKGKLAKGGIMNHRSIAGLLFLDVR